MVKEETGGVGCQEGLDNKMTFEQRLKDRKMGAMWFLGRSLPGKEKS